jgi:glycosyltransferase involved in cell wall biosynthesis
MKILHIISSLSAGGAEVYVRDLSIQMVAEGHDVCIAYISSAMATGRCAEFEAAFKRQLTDARVSFFEIGHECRRRPWQGGAALRQIIKKFNPDVVHSHLYYGLFFKVFSFVSAPLVYTHHSHRLGKGRYLYPLLNKLVDRYIGISRDCADVLRTAGGRDVTTIYNGVNVDRLIVKQKYDYERHQVDVLAIGSLREAINFTLLISVCSDLFMRRPDLSDYVTLRIAGEGSQKKELQELIERLGLTSQVTLLGNRQDIPQLLNDSDVFIMSSKWEGLPISLLEAMMTGLPVIVTDVGGCRDVVEACGAGLVIPPCDVTLLSEALEILITDSAKRYAMGTNAKDASKYFGISTACNQHLILYRTLVDKLS